MLDNSRVPPVGSLLGETEINGKMEKVIVLYTQVSRKDRALASAQVYDPEIPYFAVMDITKVAPFEKGAFEVYDESMRRELLRRNEANKEVAVALEYPEQGHVLLIGAKCLCKESVAKAKNAGYTTVSVGTAVKHLPDYHVQMDPRYLFYWEDLDLSNTNLYCCTSVDPRITKLNWKSIGWFSHNTTVKFDHLPIHHTSESVSNDALQFIFGQLNAEKLILLGVELMPDHANNVHFWSGLTMQAFMYWYSRDGREIWNCTPGGIVAGCKLGTLAEALQ